MNTILSPKVIQDKPLRRMQNNLPLIQRKRKRRKLPGLDSMKAK